MIGDKKSDGAEGNKRRRGGGGRTLEGGGGRSGNDGLAMDADFYQSNVL